jgi:hypothetical protein
LPILKGGRIGLKGHFIRRKFKSGVVFSILGIILMLATLAMIYFWETKGRERFLYTEVVVLNQSVEADTAIEPGMIDIIRINPDNLMEGAVVKKDEVIGKYSAHFIPKYSQLSLAYFKDESVGATKEDQYIFTVPADWIITFPNSLRRGDTIYFYPVKVTSEDGEQSRSFNSISSTKIIKEGELVKSEVAYLKDSGNREVVNTEGEERYDASANISSIEIITGYEDMSYLESLAESGWKFIILYKASLN